MRGREAALAGLMPARMRKRRDAKGISGADLARQVGVSPAYVSQIEKGLRVPDILVAVRIAQALEDDEALYEAWCRDHKARSRSKGTGPGPEDAWTRLYRSERFEDDGSFGQAVSSGVDIPREPGRPVQLHSAYREAIPPGAGRLLDSSVEPPGAVESLARALSSASPLVSAPVLAPGKDPGERDEVPAALQVDELLLDPRILGGARLARPFAFRADDPVSLRVRDRVAPGDLVIVSRDLEPGGPAPGRVYALRSGGRVFLGRLARFGDRFLVQPGPGETEMLDLGLAAGGSPKPAIAGEVVAVVKGG